MKTNILKTFNRLFVVGVAFAGLGFFVSCNPEPDESDIYTSTGITVNDYLKNRSDLSTFYALLQRVGLDKNLSSYGEYTCFAPNNDAMVAYINDLYNDESAAIPHNGMSSNSFDGMTDSLCLEIARYHLANGLYTSINIAPTIPTMLGRSFTTEYDSLGRVKINSVAVITEGDNETTNGLVHVLANAIPRNTRVIVDELERHKEFSIFAAALRLTGLKDQLMIAKKNVEYPDPTDWDHTDTDGTQLFAPTENRVGFTIFAESDDVFAKHGINNVDDLIAKTKEWYGGASAWYTYPGDKGLSISTGDDYTNRFNTLNMFIAYHILYAGMPESQLVYEYTSGKNGNVYWNYVNGGQPYDYYETMLPNTLMKIWQPNGHKKSNTAVDKALYINRYQSYNTLTDEVGTQGSDGMHTLVNPGVRINRTIDHKNVPTNISVYNGYIHSIQDILIYDRDVPKGVLHERMRFDTTTFLPEFINNEFRMASATTVSGWNGGGSGARIAFPLNYFDNVVSYTTENKLRYNVVGPYNAWQGNTFQGWGNYDLAVKLPPLPENTYEFRIFYTPMGHGGMMQFYMGNSSRLSDMVAIDIPLDVRVPIEDPRIGWTRFTEDDDLGIATDAAMRNRGYMRGLFSYADHADRGDVNQTDFTSENIKNERNGRYTNTGNNSLRKIMGRFTIKQSDEKWFRIKNVISDETDLKWQLDYIEFVPVDVVDNPNYSEDWF